MGVGELNGGPGGFSAEERVGRKGPPLLDCRGEGKPTASPLLPSPPPPATQ